ncbi:unnamed protein product [Discosporangium mesarthrocarpum]
MVVEALLANGADVLAGNMSGATPVEVTTVDMIQALLANHLQRQREREDDLEEEEAATAMGKVKPNPNPIKKPKYGWGASGGHPGVKGRKELGGAWPVGCVGEAGGGKQQEESKGPKGFGEAGKAGVKKKMVIKLKPKKT